MIWNDNWIKTIFWSLIFIIVQLGIPVYIFLTRRQNMDEFLVNFGLIMMMFLFNLGLVIQKIMQRKKEFLEEKIREQLFLDRLNDQKRLTEKEKLDQMAELNNSLRMNIDAMRNTIHMLKNGKVGPSIDEYFMQPIKGNVVESFCENALINAVMYNKAEECKRNEIIFEVKADIPNDLKVTGYDLCSIFSNLLDNAIEACKELPAGGRKISVEVNLFGTYLYVEVKNTSTLEHAKRPYRTGHGYGMLIVKQIAKKCDGDVSIEFIEGGYLVEVMMRVR